MERDKKVIDLYLSGSTPTNIANELNINRRSIYRILKRNNIDLINKVSDEGKCVICNKDCGSRRKRCDTCNTKIRRYRAKKAAVEHLGGECNRCRWVGNLAGFDIHHKDTEVKTFNPSAVHLANRTWEEVKKELETCELLCAICHRLEHNDYENEEFIRVANSINEDLIFKNIE